MTAIQLRDMLVRYCDLHSRDAETCRVVIQESRSGCPHAPMVDVQSAGPGADWTRGMFILRPDEPLVRVRILSRPKETLARIRLAQIKEAHARTGFEYIKKVREYEWIEGFKRGVEEHITSALEDIKQKGAVSL